MTPDDIKVIRASAKRIIALAAELSDKRRRDFVVEAATIIQLTEK